MELDNSLSFTGKRKKPYKRGDIYSANYADVKNKIWIHTIKLFDIPGWLQIESPAAVVGSSPESEPQRKGLTMRVNANIWL